MKGLLGFAKVTGVYFLALAGTCCLAALLSLPLAPRDFEIGVVGLALVRGLSAGLYTLTLLPVILPIHFLMRSFRFHVRFPITVFAALSTVLPIAGTLVFRGHFWPDYPVDMEPMQIWAFVVIAALAIEAGLAVVLCGGRQAPPQPSD